MAKLDRANFARIWNWPQWDSQYVLILSFRNTTAKTLAKGVVTKKCQNHLVEGQSQTWHDKSNDIQSTKIWMIFFSTNIFSIEYCLERVPVTLWQESILNFWLALISKHNKEKKGGKGILIVCKKHMHCAISGFEKKKAFKAPCFLFESFQAKKTPSQLFCRILNERS